MVAGPDSPNPLTVFPPEHESVCAASPQVCDRLGRFEASFQRTESYAAETPWVLSCARARTIAYERLGRVEETMDLGLRSLDDSTLPEMYVGIERQVEETRVAVRRAEAAVASQSLREIFEEIDERLARTEETLQRTERLVAAWRREFSATRSVSPAQFEAITRMAWTARLVVPVIVLLIVFIGGLIWTSRSTTPETVASVAPPPTREPVTVALTTNVPAPTPTREKPIPAPRPRSAVRPPTIVAPQRQMFFGTLSITSIPSGAMVSINGQAAGVTPLRLPRQRAGSHAVQIAQDGFERWSAAVRVPADQLTQVTARLHPIAQ